MLNASFKCNDGSFRSFSQYCNSDVKTFNEPPDASWLHESLTRSLRERGEPDEEVLAEDGPGRHLAWTSCLPLACCCCLQCIASAAIIPGVSLALRLLLLYPLRHHGNRPFSSSLRLSHPVQSTSTRIHPVMQRYSVLILSLRGHCNADEPFADLTNDSPEDGDLSVYSWIGSAASYLCEAPVS